ncbi:MAG: DUF5069 domain-containing protein [Verrucomicrobiota bacterium]
MKPPISAYEETLGMRYFARMLDKIRKYDVGELREDFHENLGKSLDGRCVSYLRVDYAEVVERTLSGGSDEEILEWCFERGRALDENDVLIWNQFSSKLGFRDHVSEVLEERKRESHLEDRDDIVTMFDYFEADEGRS